MPCPSRHRARRSIAAGLALAAVVTLGTFHALGAQSVNSPSGLKGTWFVQVTLRNCDTNAPLGQPFSSVVTFHQGGTTTEATSAPAFAIGQRSDGQGTWSHLRGSTYHQRMGALIRFDTPPNPPASPGFLRGWQTVTQTVEQTDPDNFTSSGTNAFYRWDGELYRTGCSDAVGVRF